MESESTLFFAQPSDTRWKVLFDIPIIIPFYASRFTVYEPGVGVSVGRGVLVGLGVRVGGKVSVGLGVLDGLGVMVGVGLAVGVGVSIPLIV
jgi:hypothetical protein